jgi:hypothetical protein
MNVSQRNCTREVVQMNETTCNKIPTPILGINQSTVPMSGIFKIAGAILCTVSEV